MIRDRVGLVGLSQGGKIAPIAASASDAVAFVVNLVGAASPLKEQVSWEMYHTFRYWRKVTQPLLVMYGEDDHNVPTVDSVYRLIRVWRQMDHPDATLRIIPGTGHGLWEPKADPHRPVLHPSVVTILGEWLTTRLLH